MFSDVRVQTVFKKTIIMLIQVFADDVGHDVIVTTQIYDPAAN